MASIHTSQQLWELEFKEKEVYRRHTLDVIHEQIHRNLSKVSYDLEDPNFDFADHFGSDGSDKLDVRVSLRKVTDYMNLVVVMDARVVDELIRWHPDRGRDVFDFKQGRRDPHTIFGVGLILSTSRDEFLVPTRYIWEEKQ